MIRFSARYFDGQTSAAKNVEVVALDASILEVRDGKQFQTYAIEDCQFEAPLGRTRRVILLPDNGRLETGDLAQYDDLQNWLRPGLGLRWVHWLESGWRWVLGSLARIDRYHSRVSYMGSPLDGVGDRSQNARCMA